MGLNTTTVGWFPWSAELGRMQRDHREGDVDDAALQAAAADEMRDALRLQEDLGLDVHVDGQFDRGDMISFLAERIDGTEEGGLVRCFGNRYYRKPVITGAVSRNGPLTVDVWKRARAAASRPVKAVITGPYTLMHCSFDEHYGSRAECCRAMTEIVRDEVVDLVAAGAEEIQIDEPAIGARPDEMELAASVLARVTEAARGRARTWAWLGYGDLGPVLDRVLSLPVDGLLLEMANSGLEIVDGLDRLPADKLLGAGVLDVLTDEVESQDVLGRRIERLSQKVPRDRLWLVPDAGLRTLTPETARDKLRAMVAAAG